MVYNESSASQILFCTRNLSFITSVGGKLVYFHMCSPQQKQRGVLLCHGACLLQSSQPGHVSQQPSCCVHTLWETLGLQNIKYELPEYGKRMVTAPIRDIFLFIWEQQGQPAMCFKCDSLWLQNTVANATMTYELKWSTWKQHQHHLPLYFEINRKHLTLNHEKTKCCFCLFCLTVAHTKGTSLLK